MILKPLKPKQSLNKAYLKQKLNRIEIDKFKINLSNLLNGINDEESEEFHKNLIIDFLKKTYYDPNHFVNTKGRNDLVIHNDKDANSSVGVIFETKKTTNKFEMISYDNLNTKAFQELVLYYLRERISFKNLEVKHLVITNINEWFIFDVNVFDRLFAQNKDFVKQFTDFEEGRLADTRTEFFYKQIAEPFINNLKSEIEFTYFNIKDYKAKLKSSNKNDDISLIALYKLLSPEHLLKLPFANDSNSLDKRFYSELLHIMGLTEVKDKGKNIITRNKEGQRNTASFIEDSIIQLDSLEKLSRIKNVTKYGDTRQEQLFNVALELTITWINRVLFLKLLEAQLIAYHKGDMSYSFLSFDIINNFDVLNTLFFQVLARKYEDRNEDVKLPFAKVPYLNSSLFELSDIEHTTLFISNLRDDKLLPIHSQTVLKDSHGKKRTGNITTLQYLFEFLDSYDFGAEGNEEIRDDSKTLINASVLGLIFEKINGYKDGSFFTPGFITMYMCRETIRKAVVQKFNEATTPLLRGVGGVSKTHSIETENIPVSNSIPRRTIIPYNPKLKDLARELRNNSTKSEIILWKELKGKFEGKYDFHRQKPLDNYIADFFCYELKLVIEIDGSSHELEETIEKDIKKEYRLNELGLNVLRFPDSDIFNQLEATLETIKAYIRGFEDGDLSEFKYEGSPLNPLSTDVGGVSPLLRGVGGVSSTTTTVAVSTPFSSLDDIYEQIGDDRLFTREQANQIINSIKICDPAVGSGHFLVSSLNEIIAIKNDLKILQDREGKRLKEYHIEVVNDELIVTDEDGELFEYNPKSRESQRVQETLFHEKQTIIENCLFGVDLNINSVKICRLRLWIELLKNAYYTPLLRGAGGVSPLLRGVGGVLETLPNIDINIKTGNSLISKYSLDTSLKSALRNSKWNIQTYRIAISTYRNSKDRQVKREMEDLILSIKQSITSEIRRNDPLKTRLDKLVNDLYNNFTGNFLFEPEVPYNKNEKELEKKRKKEKEKLEKEISKISKKIDEIKNNKIYENAFEWRFEFPEVLNDDGDFIGFDIVIGNPPYIKEYEGKEIFDGLRENEVYMGKMDLWFMFAANGIKLLKDNGSLSLIAQNNWVTNAGAEKFRNFILNNTKIEELIDFGSFMVFDTASIQTMIMQFSKQKGNNYKFNFRKLKGSNLTQNDALDLLFKIENSNTEYLQPIVFKENLYDKVFTFQNQEAELILNKMIEKSNFQLDTNEVANGIHPHHDFVTNKILEDLGAEFKLGDGIFGLSEQELENLNLLENEKELIKPYFNSKQFHRYYASNENQNWLIYTSSEFKDPNKILPYPNIKKHLDKFQTVITSDNKPYGLHRTRVEDFFIGEKIIVTRKCPDKPIFTYTDFDTYVSATFYVIKTNRFNQKALTGILNSKLIEFWLKHKGKMQGANYQLDKAPLVDLPIIAPSTYIQNQISLLVEEIINNKTENIEFNTSIIEAKIDQMVYELYELTDEETEVVENSVK